ncbi:methylthioribulose 1-phosphate dehydratase [Coleofasciculus sp. E1-EBD-02]|uniref:methylthioribulose 1-phosphate dehydratase n=1 Tax=Coleofasciculus sp. E1-EBD-02 TaxID=3068481 RepID=UPI0032F52E1F
MQIGWLEDKQTKAKAIELTNVIRFFANRGWTPATSSNFSFVKDQEQKAFVISRSGQDKSQFKPNHFMLIDERGQAIEPKEAKPSAETLIHLSLYNWQPIECVLHTHSPASTVLSMKYAGLGTDFAHPGEMTFTGYEIKKAFDGIDTHDTTVTLPIFPNSQNMVEFANNLNHYLAQRDELFGFAIAGHGLYTWGNTIQAAKRHVEAWEFLFECRLLELRMG